MTELTTGVNLWLCGDNPRSRPMAVIVVEPASDDNEKRLLVLRQRERLAGNRAAVIPARLERQDYLRLGQALEVVGLELSLLPDGDQPSGVLPDIIPDPPDAILTVGELGENIELLAGALTGLKPGPLGEVLQGAYRTAVILKPVDHRLTDREVDGLRRLQVAGATVGFVSGATPSAIKAHLMKTLLVDKVTGAGDVSFAWSGFENRRSDLLVLSGHASRFDAYLDDHHVLCTREEGTNSGDVYPCFYNGRCFRTANDGRPAKIVSPHQLNARIIIVCGCNLTTLLGASDSGRHEIVEHLRKGRALAAIVSTRLMPNYKEIGLLAAAMVAEGMPLGNVVVSLNSRLKDLFGIVAISSDIADPFILFGNPRLRLLRAWGPRDTLPLKIAPAADGETRAIESPENLITFETYQPSSESAYLLGAVPVIAATQFPASPGGQERLVSLVRQATDIGQSACTLEVASSSPCAATLSQLDKFIRELTFWTYHLVSCSEALLNFEKEAAEILRSCEPVCIALSKLQKARAMLTLRPGIFTDRELVIARVEYARSIMFHTSEMLRDVLAMMSQCLGSSHFLSWGGLYEWQPSPVQVRRCSCEQAFLVKKIGVLRGSTSHERALYECPCCGAVGEDDGRELLEVEFLENEIRRGANCRVKITIAAPANEDLVAATSSGLECWYHIAPEMPPMMNCFAISRGETIEREVSFNVDQNAQLGLHVVGVVGVVNGALYVRKHLIAIK